MQGWYYDLNGIGHLYTDGSCPDAGLPIDGPLLTVEAARTCQICKAVVFRKFAEASAGVSDMWLYMGDLDLAVKSADLARAYSVEPDTD